MRKAARGKHDRRSSGMGRRKRKHDAPMRGDGLWPHVSDDWRERRFFGEAMEEKVRRRVVVVAVMAV